MVDGTGAGQESAASDGGMSIGDYVSDVFGDTVEGAESQPVVTSDAAGAPPAERQQATGENPASPEGSKNAERADTPSADAAKSESDKGATPTTEADGDPLATATPFTYTVNGQEKAFDGIKVLGDAGAIITSDALPLLQRRLGERDNLYEQNRAQYDQVKDFERLSEWKTEGPDGKEVTLQGRDGLVAMHSDHESLKAAWETFIQVLKPAADGSYPLLAALVDVDPKTNQIIANPEFVERLLERSNNAEFRARVSVRDRLAETSTPRPTAGRSAEASTALNSSSIQAEAPRIIEAAAKEQGVDLKLLTEKDRAFLSQQLPRYLRSVTEDDRRENLSLKVGSPIVDSAFAQVVKDRAELRKEMGTQAQAASQAAKDNSARLAAAALGSRKVSTPTQRVQERQPEDTRVSDADAAWALRERLSSGKFSTT